MPLSCPRTLAVIPLAATIRRRVCVPGTSTRTARSVCPYALRPPVAQERLHVTDEGQVRLRLRVGRGRAPAARRDAAGQQHVHARPGVCPVDSHVGA